MGPVSEGFVEDVLSLVEQIPAGRVTTYGTIGDALGRGARHVGRVMALHGHGVPWWRVVRSDGSLAEPLRERAVQEYAAEGTPVRRTGAVDLVAAYWQPDAPSTDLHRA